MNPSLTKRKRGHRKAALQIIKLRLDYAATAILATLFAAPFWFFEQRRGKLLDRIEAKRCEL